MNFLCYSSCAKNVEPPQYAIDYVDKYMDGSVIGQFSGVSHLDINEIDKIEECKQYENLKAKMFNFNLIDMLSKQGLLKENPLNAKSL